VELSAKKWQPPGKNCGLCGETSCSDLLRRWAAGQKEPAACPYYQLDLAQKKEAVETVNRAANYSGHDILGHPYDFVLTPLPGELSARKIVLPFRGDLVEKLQIKSGDYVVGRPMGAGCPIPHVLQVITADQTTGLLTTWVVGPQYAREAKVIEVQAYHMIGFEGIAKEIRKEPVLGSRVTFLPGFCMMNLNHTALVNMILAKKCGLHLCLEDVRILSGA